MKRDALKQFIKTVINEIQDTEVRKQRLARVGQQTQANIQNTISQLHTKIDADKRKKNAEPILNKKPFKKPFNELVGEEPKLGQFKWDYEIQIHVKTPYGEYDTTDISKWAPIKADTEEEAKKLALSPYNPKVVTIKNIKMIKRGPITQADVDQWKKSVEYYGHALRPKDQGGWGADEGVVKEDAGAHFDAQHKFLVANYQSGFSRYFSTEQEAVDEAELIGGEVYEVKRQIKYKYLGYPAGLEKANQRLQKRQQAKLNKPMSKADLVNMDPGRSSMGGPTSGW